MIRERPSVLAGGERQRSLALAELVPGRRDRSSAAFSVLDLGPASRDNLEFFGKTGARLTIADLYRSLGHQRPRSAGLFAKLLRYPHEDRFDLVLAWDVLNYLVPEELGALVESLAVNLRSGTLVHAFIVTSREMAPEPICYGIEDEKTLIPVSRHGRPIRAPRYVEPELLRSMPGLTVEHRFQLRNGMAEYVFTFRPRQRAEAGLRAPSSVRAPGSPSEKVIEWTPVPSR